MLTILGLLAVLVVCFTIIGSVPATAQPRPPVPWHEDVAPPPTGPTVPAAEPATANYGDVIVLLTNISVVSPGAGVLPVEPASAPSISIVSSLSSELVTVAVTGGVSLPVEQATAGVGVTMLDVASDAIKPPSAARASAWQPWWESFTTGETEAVNPLALLLACDDEPALREHLISEGLTLRQPGGPVRALPQDFLVGVTAYEYADAYCQADQDVLENVEPPAGMTAAGVTVLRFVERSARAVTFTLANPDRPYLIIQDIHGLSVDALRVLAGSNVVGVVVGHYRHADDEPVDFAAAADDVLRVTRAVRLVSDAPILLAVGAVNIHTRDTERGWADAFGDDIRGFDGFAIYGLARFPAILEAVENPRELILRRMGLPDRPCILIEFMGSSYNYSAADRPYVEKLWNARAGQLIAALRKQQWRGLVTWSADLDDARIKAAALRNAVK